MKDGGLREDTPHLSGIKLLSASYTTDFVRGANCKASPKLSRCSHDKDQSRTVRSSLRIRYNCLPRLGFREQREVEI
jgi:hypothetical protein